MEERYMKAVETRKKRKSYKHTEKSRKKISDSVKKSHQKKNYGFQKGLIPWNTGIPMSEENKKRLSIMTKKQLKEKGHPFQGMLHSEESKKKMSKNRMGKSKGKGRYNWKGGSPLWRSMRTDARWKPWREKVFKRDNYTCQNKNCKYCKNKRGIRNLHPHHKKPLASFPELCFEISNGVTLCSDYHLKGGLHR